MQQATIFIQEFHMHSDMHLRFTFIQSQLQFYILLCGMDVQILFEMHGSIHFYQRIKYNNNIDRKKQTRKASSHHITQSYSCLFLNGKIPSTVILI